MVVYCVPWWLLPLKWLGDAFLLGMRLVVGGFVILCRLVAAVGREVFPERDRL